MSGAWHSTAMAFSPSLCVTSYFTTSWVNSYRKCLRCPFPTSTLPLLLEFGHAIWRASAVSDFRSWSTWRPTAGAWEYLRRAQPKARNHLGLWLGRCTWRVSWLSTVGGKVRLTSAISFFTVGSHLGFFDWPDCCDDAWFRSVELEVLISEENTSWMRLKVEGKLIFQPILMVCGVGENSNHAFYSFRLIEEQPSE